MEPTQRQPPHPVAPEARDAAASGGPGTGGGGDDRLAPPPEAGQDLEAIAARAARGGFFWLVSVLERLVPGAPRVGGFGPAADESLRFRHDPLLVFNTSDVSDVKLDGRFEEPRFRIQTTFLGLTGAASPLPGYMPEEVMLEDTPLRRDFLDLFHHRIVSLFYRAVTKYDPPREHLSDASDAWSLRLLSLAGRDHYDGPIRSRLPPKFWLRVSPLMATTCRSANTLERVMCEALAEVLLKPDGVNVQQFIGDWNSVESDQRFQLGFSHHRLGGSTVLGGRVFDRSGKFLLDIGPVEMSDLDRFREGGDLLEVVREVAGAVAVDPLDFDVSVFVAEGAARSFTLKRRGGAGLGRTSWLRSRGTREIRITVPGRAAPSPAESTAP